MNESAKYKSYNWTGSHELSLRTDPTLPEEEDTIVVKIKQNEQIKVDVEDTIVGWNDKTYCKAKHGLDYGYVLKEALING